MRARIRVSVTFAPPDRPASSLACDGRLSRWRRPAAPAGDEAPQAMDEVRVLGQREPKSPTERMGRAEMRVVPVLSAIRSAPST